jgi:L-ribulokinase
LDYVESMAAAIQGALAAAGAGVATRVVGIAIDATGSTPAPVDASGRVLAMNADFQDNPNAMFCLWKDHTANAEAAEINKVAHRWTPDYTRLSGGRYSSEWFFSKILHVLRADEAVAAAAVSWVEQSDWLPALLIGCGSAAAIPRNRCAAGHKAMWCEAHGGLPSAEFLAAVDPRLAGLRSSLYCDTVTADRAVGKLCPEWAARLGLSTDVVVAAGSIDAHAGAVGAQIVPGCFVRVMGTSTCDMLVVPPADLVAPLHESGGTTVDGIKVVPGICGQVDGSIVPGLVGLEAGQSAFGDVFAWFRRLVVEPVRHLLGDEAAVKLAGQLLPHLSDQAAALPITATDPIGLDWFNGRRTPDADLTLRGGLLGLSLADSAVSVFKALVEATAFGSRAIVERCQREGVALSRVVALGGVARKSPYVMQTLADVLGMPIHVAACDEACALGAAMYAAVAAGVHPDVPTAQAAMGSGFDMVYEPRPALAPVYGQLYERYRAMCAFAEAGTHAPAKSF